MQADLVSKASSSSTGSGSSSTGGDGAGGAHTQGRSSEEAELRSFFAGGGRAPPPAKAFGLPEAPLQRGDLRTFFQPKAAKGTAQTNSGKASPPNSTMTKSGSSNECVPAGSDEDVVCVLGDDDDGGSNGVSSLVSSSALNDRASHASAGAAVSSVAAYSSRSSPSSSSSNNAPLHPWTQPWNCPACTFQNEPPSQPVGGQSAFRTKPRTFKRPRCEVCDTFHPVETSPTESPPMPARKSQEFEVQDASSQDVASAMATSIQAAVRAHGKPGSATTSSSSSKMATANSRGELVDSQNSMRRRSSRSTSSSDMSSLFKSPLLLFGVSANTGRIALFKPATASATKSISTAAATTASSSTSPQALAPPPTPLRVSFTLESFAESGFMSPCPEEDVDLNSVSDLDDLTTPFAVYAAAQASQEEAAKQEGCSVRVPGRLGEMLAAALGGPSGVAALTFHLQTTLAASAACRSSASTPTVAKSTATSAGGNRAVVTQVVSARAKGKATARPKIQKHSSLAAPEAPRFSLLVSSDDSGSDASASEDDETCAGIGGGSSGRAPTIVKPQPVVTLAHAIVQAIAEVSNDCSCVLP